MRGVAMAILAAALAAGCDSWETQCTCVREACETAQTKQDEAQALAVAWVVQNFARPTAPPPQSQGAACLELNTATAEALMTLPGIGKSRASEILRLRAKRPFRRNTDIMRVKGIGKKTFKKIAPHLCNPPERLQAH